MSRLKQKDIAEWRLHTLAKQGGRCALTHYTLDPKDAVADHEHTSGRMRGVIHRGVNSMLGHLENNRRRYGLSWPQIFSMCRNLEAYIQEDRSGQPLHPTFKTDDEKRELRNKRARVKRAKAKKE